MEEFLKALFEAKEAVITAGDKSVKIRQVDVDRNTCLGCVLDTNLNINCGLYCSSNKQFRIVED